MNSSRILLCTVALASGLSAQASWTELFPTTSPSARAAGYGGTDGFYMYHFGGRIAGGIPQNEIWRFDGTDWTNLMPTGTLPSGRRWGAGCFDVGRNKFVIFGGNTTGSTVVGDTWEYDPNTNTWADVTPASGSPSARKWSAMAFDYTSGKCLMYGGQNAAGAYLDETWEWDGTNWNQLTPANQPGALAGFSAGIGRHRMASNLFDLEILMYGGRSGGTLLNDTFRWDGTNWTQVTTASSPPIVQAGNLVYDEARNRYMTYGGASASGIPLNFVWEFDGTDWTDRGTYVGNGGQTTQYVPVLQKTFVFGGFNGSMQDRTHEYQTDTFASFTAGTTGLGCAGSNGVVPQQTGLGLPWTGDTFEIAVTGLNPAAFAKVMFFDVLIPITPVPLDAIGQVGCNLVANPVIEIPLGVTNSVVIPVPNDTGLAGFAMFTQAIGLEIAPDVLGMSDRGDLVVGVR